MNIFRFCLLRHTEPLLPTFFSVEFLVCGHLSLHNLFAFIFFRFRFAFMFGSISMVKTNFVLILMLTWFSYHLSIFIVDSLPFAIHCPSEHLTLRNLFILLRLRIISAEKNNEWKCTFFLCSRLWPPSWEIQNYTVCNADFMKLISAFILGIFFSFIFFVAFWAWNIEPNSAYKSLKWMLLFD